MPELPKGPSAVLRQLLSPGALVLGVGLSGALLSLGATTPPSASSEPAHIPVIAAGQSECATSSELLCPLFHSAGQSPKIEKDDPCTAARVTRSTSSTSDSSLSCKWNPTGIRNQFIVALVPDPTDSPFDYSFDRYLDSIRIALETSGYLLDQYQFPWRAAGVPDDKLPKAQSSFVQSSKIRPGVAIFRRQHEFLTLLLVGETPTAGIHREAFLNALNVQRLGADEPATVRIIGPTFSGSTDSVRDAIQQWRCSHKNVEFSFISGTATACRNKQRLTIEGYSKFSATVLPDDIAICSVYRYFNEHGISRDRIAVLSESNTAYGGTFRSMEKGTPSLPQLVVTGVLAVMFGDDEGASQCNGSDNKGASSGQLVLEGIFSRVSGDDENIGACEPRCPALDPTLHLTFPLHISELRSAYQRGRAAGPDIPHRLLDLSLDDARAARDVLAPTSRLTTESVELVLTSLLTRLAQARVTAVLIAATDARDVIFLGELIHRYAPDLRLFTMGSDILYTHDEVAYLNGMILVSSYPLLIDNQTWSYPHTGEHQWRQFPTDVAQGVYNATLLLVDKDANSHVLEYGMPFASAARTPALWLTAIGNGSIWPLHAEPVNDSPYLAKLDTEGDKKFDDTWRPPVTMGFFITLLLFTCFALCIHAAFWAGQSSDRAKLLARSAFWTALAEPFGIADQKQRTLRYFALLTVAGVGAAQFEMTSLLRFAVVRESVWDVAATLHKCLLGFAMLSSVIFIATASVALVQTLSPRWRVTPTRAFIAFVASAIVVVVVVVIDSYVRSHASANPVLRGDVLFAYLRVSNLGSSLSYLMPALFLCTGISFFGFIKMRTLHRITQQEIPSSTDEQVVAASKKLAERFGNSIGSIPTTVLLIVLFAFSCAIAFRNITQSFDGPWAFAILHVILLAFMTANAILASWLFSLWLEFRRYLESIADGRASTSSLFEQLKPFKPWIEFVRGHVQELLTCLTVCLLLLLFATNSYPFVMERSLVAFVWLFSAVAIVITIVIIVGLNRNEALSTLSGTEPGRLTIDQSLISSLVVHVVLPLVGLYAARSPSVAGYITRWLEPVLRALRH
jgi:hypothetical protein